MADTIPLPKPLLNGKLSLETVLHKRRSIRRFSQRSLNLFQIGQLAWAAQGITAAGRFRTAPSAGALYPLEVFIISGNVENLPTGVYHYTPKNHILTKTTDGDLRKQLYQAALMQSAVGNAAAVFVIAAVYSRCTVKYGTRGFQYTHMEAGHAAQNFLLQAVSLGIGAVVIGAFNGRSVKRCLGLSAHQEPLYLMPVGR